MHECEVWLLVDENGDYVVHKEAGELADAYENDVGNDHSLSRRVVKVTVQVPCPAHVELKGTAPAEGGGVLSVA